MKWSLVSRVLIPVVFVSLPAFSQDTLPATNANCPLALLHFNSSGVSVRIENTSGKAIVGLVFKVALSDATEHWKWVHWNFDEHEGLALYQPACSPRSHSSSR